MRSELRFNQNLDFFKNLNLSKLKDQINGVCLQTTCLFSLIFLPLITFSQITPPLGIDTSQMILWLSPDTAVFNSSGNPAAIGETVYEWHDISGNNWVFENTFNSRRPSLDTSGGLTYLDFSGGDFLENLIIDDSINGINEFSIFFTVKSRVTNTDNGFLYHRYPPNGQDDEICLRYDRAGASTGRSQVIKAGLLNNTAGNQIETTSNVQTTDRQVITITWSSGGRLYSYIDGAPNDSSDNNVNGPLSGIDRILIGKGAKDNSVNSGWDGYIGSIVFYRNQYSDDTISQVSTALPINLVSFSAKQVEETVLLEWVTASETNNDYFTIEKSKDIEHFEVITNVPGAGNSAAPLNYSFVDENPYKDTTYYRLKQTDYDGNFKYVGILAINKNLRELEEVKLYPNPSDGNSFNLQMNADRDREVSLMIYSPLGEAIYSEVFMQNEGSMQKTFRLPNRLSPGVYLIVGRSKDILFRKSWIVY